MSEYWIDEGGNVTYCDGDAGADVANHEGVARQHAASKVVDALQSLDASDPLAGTIMRVFENHLDHDGVLDCISLRCALADLDAFAGDETVTEAITRLTGLPELEVRFALQTEPHDEDVRLYAMRVWGWHRVVCKGSFHTIESWRVSRSAIKRLYFPIGEIEDECDAGSPTWTWYVRGSRKEFEIASADMESGIIPRAEVS